MQYFKGDAVELQMAGSGVPTNDLLSSQKDDFFDGAYACFALGDLLYTTARSPLANAIDQIIFRESFPVIYDAFVAAGTFESYLTVFRNIFGDDVTVTFTVPGPGELSINIAAAGTAEYDLVARTIIDGVYVYDSLLDAEGGNNIEASLPKGFSTQYELEQMLFEMVPDGIYTSISLSIGS